MGTTKTIENKTLLFAQYWMQFVYKDVTQLRKEPFQLNELDTYFVSNGYLELKNPAFISNEDALELVYMKLTDDKFAVNRITKLTNLKINHKPNKPFIMAIEVVVNSDNYAPFVDRLFLGDRACAKYIDFLRSKGYAAPFRNLSIEKQIEHNWIKLTTGG